MNFEAFAPFQLDAQAMQQLQQGYLKELQALWGEGALNAPSQDRRFSSEAWSANPIASFTTALYLLNARTMMQMVDCIQADEKTKARLRFATEQQIAAASPSNFLALNPDALKKAQETQGQSIAQGLQNMLHDMRQGHVSMTDESQFEVGRNVGTTEGAVVFENELFQLIEYKPLTKQVHERPFLVIPPCINKFYILDLQPANSMVRHLVQEGHRTFVISWRNPDESLQEKTWDDYIEHAAIKAIALCAQYSTASSPKGSKNAVKKLPTEAINALGFCVGGTMLGTALGVLAARGEKPVASATFLTTFLDFSDTGILDIFIDEASVKQREQQFAAGGLLKGQELASTFSFLRPNDLVWNYVVGNYLKGETPPPFDLLYWNSDATNLPGPFYAWYLRNTYLENNLRKPGKLTVCGEKLDLSKIDIPVYIYGSREDHIVPIGVNGGGAYASTQILSGKKRFVMGASGHIAGVINAPAAKKRSHWIGKDNHFPATQAEWLKTAKEHPGSWWTDWFTWLKPLSGKLIAAPRSYSAKLIEPAPGRYVKAKA
jgi:polyhydroxyalkanoate synthase subunit PhaC